MNFENRIIIVKENATKPVDGAACDTEIKGKPLNKLNFWLMIVAGAMIVLGFVLMLGAPSGDTFNPDIFSTRRIVIGPTISFLGYIFMGFAIMWRPRCKRIIENQTK